MRLSLILNEYKRKWMIHTMGVFLFGFGFTILSSNEGRAINNNRALAEALTQAVSFKDENYYTPDAKSVNYEGQLLHVNGMLRVQEPIGDGTYNILVQAVKLRKLVQMYQWHEDFTENKFAEGDETQRNYFYFKDWNHLIVDSRSFHKIGYQNPRQMPMQNKVITADRALIGSFELSDAAKELFDAWHDVTSDTRPEDSYIKMHSGWYFHVDDLFDPLVGDVRLKFQFAGLQGDSYTIVGLLKNGKIEPYQNHLKRDILLLQKGELTIDQIFKVEHNNVWKRTWYSRLFGTVLVFFGVISTETLLAFFSNTRFSYLAPHPHKQFQSYLKIAISISVSICILRTLLHFFL